MTFARTQHLFARLESGEGYNKTHDEEVLNPFMNWHNNPYTQEFARALVSEAVQARGIELYYLRREFVNLDLLFGEDNEARFSKAYRVAMYLQSFDSYEGQRDFFSKFGMSVNDEMTLIVSPELFKVQADGDRCRAGDLLYFPMNKALFEIVWVEPNAIFFQAGQESQYRINAQKFIYSGEELKPEFDPKDHFLDNTLDPIRNLDGRVDIDFDEFDEDDDISEEADEFVYDFEPPARGVNPINKPHPIAPTVDVPDEFNNGPFTSF